MFSLLKMRTIHILCLSYNLIFGGQCIRRLCSLACALLIATIRTRGLFLSHIILRNNSPNWIWVGGYRGSTTIRSIIVVRRIRGLVRWSKGWRVISLRWRKPSLSLLPLQVCQIISHLQNNADWSCIWPLNSKPCSCRFFFILDICSCNFLSNPCIKVCIILSKVLISLVDVEGEEVIAKG